MVQESSNQKLFILVRNDIPIPDQMAQACHAAEIWATSSCNDFKAKTERERGRSGTTVVLSVEGYRLSTWQRKLEQLCAAYIAVQEPDMDNLTTAIACLTDTNIFSGLPLWTGKLKEDQPY